MILDPRWWTALTKELPSKTVAGLFLASLLLLIFNLLGFVPLAAFNALLPVAVAIVVIVCAAFLAGGEIYERYKEQQKTAKLFARRQLRSAEKDAARAEAEAAVLERIDFLSEGELRFVADALRRNAQTITAWASSSHVGSLVAKRFLIPVAGSYKTDAFPFVFDDFVWKALLARKDELIAKDDENQRRAKDEEAARARKQAY